MATGAGEIGRPPIMHLGHLPGDVHLTYCTNIHAGETWDEVRTSLEEHVPHIKARVSPHAPMGLGLRLSAIAAEELSAASQLDTLRSFLANHGLYVFTINAFPYGPFHGRRVKEAVYQPDWLSPERLAFTDRAARILAGSCRPAKLVRYLQCRARSNRLRRVLARRPRWRKTSRVMPRPWSSCMRSGRELVLALEPEPCCFLETVEETIAYFRNHLHADFCAAVLAQLTGLDVPQAREALRRHVGVCYDVCHGAVEYEEPAAAFRALESAGIRVAKIQVSSALRLPQSQRDHRTGSLGVRRRGLSASGGAETERQPDTLR